MNPFPHLAGAMHAAWRSLGSLATRRGLGRTGSARLIGRRAPVLALLATGFLCTAAAAQAQEGATPPRRIGLLVLAGHEVRLLQIGVLVFGNAYGQVPAPDARLADALQDVLHAELAGEPGQIVRRLQVPWDALQRLSPRAHEGSSGFWGPSLSDLRGDLVRLAAGCDCDTLLVVSSRMAAEVLGTNQVARGITWVRTPGRQGLMVPLHLYVVDPATGQVRAHTHVLPRLSPVAAPWPLDTAAATAARPPGAASAADEGASAAGPVQPPGPPVAGKPSEPPPKTRWTEAEWAALVSAARPTRSIETDALSAVYGLSLSLARIGLRPSCAMTLYELTTTRRQRDPAFADHVRPPSVPAGADPALCPVKGGVGPG